MLIAVGKKPSPNLVVCALAAQFKDIMASAGEILNDGFCTPGVAFSYRKMVCTGFL